MPGALVSSWLAPITNERSDPCGGDATRQEVRPEEQLLVRRNERLRRRRARLDGRARDGRERSVRSHAHGGVVRRSTGRLPRLLALVDDVQGLVRETQADGTRAARHEWGTGHGRQTPVHVHVEDGHRGTAAVHGEEQTMVGARDDLLVRVVGTRHLRGLPSPVPPVEKGLPASEVSEPSAARENARIEFMPSRGSLLSTYRTFVAAIPPPAAPSGAWPPSGARPSGEETSVPASVPPSLPRRSTARRSCRRRRSSCREAPLRQRAAKTGRWDERLPCSCSVSSAKNRPCQLVRLSMCKAPPLQMAARPFEEAAFGRLPTQASALTEWRGGREPRFHERLGNFSRRAS